MNYEYSFDFDPNPGFIYDAWFLKSLKPLLLLSLLLFPLSYFSDFWITHLVIPSIAAGAIILFVGLYLYRRILSQRRLRGVADTRFHYRIDDEGIHYDNALGRGLLRWGFKGKLYRVNTFILLQSSEVGLLPLPADTPAEVLAKIESQLL